MTQYNVKFNEESQERAEQMAVEIGEKFIEIIKDAPDDANASEFFVAIAVASAAAVNIFAEEDKAPVSALRTLIDTFVMFQTDKAIQLALAPTEESEETEDAE